jgi:hypothetical protein
MDTEKAMCLGGKKVPSFGVVEAQQDKHHINNQKRARIKGTENSLLFLLFLFSSII